MKDGVITDQEKNGYLDERGQLTSDAKSRIAKALVGRMFETPADYSRTAPDIRNKLERIAPQVLRVEDRPEWSITEPIREAVTVLADAKAHGIKNLDDLTRQPDQAGQMRSYSPDAVAIAKTLQNGKAARSFRQYAIDAEMSREGSPRTFFEPPTQQEAFQAAFGEQPEPLLSRHELGSSGALRESVDEGLPLFRPFRDKPFDRNTDLENLAGDAEVKYHPGRQGGPPVVYANPHATEVLRRTMGEKTPHFWGATLTAPDLKRVMPRLREAVGSPDHTPQARKGFAQLYGSLALARQQAPHAIVIAHGPWNAMRRALKEEYFHHAWLAGKERYALGVPLEVWRENPNVARGMDNLMRTGYTLIPHVALAELAAKVGHPYEWPELGLTKPEAFDAADAIASRLREQRGAEAENALRWWDRDFRKELDAFHDFRQGQAGDGQLRPGKSGRGSPPGSSNGGSDGPGGGGSLFGRSSSGPGAREPSLFDSGENDEVARTAARDRDQLEGQRLTAQIDSPLTRDEQLKNLKPSKERPQTNFSEDTTSDQGALFSRTKPGDEEERELTPQRHFSTAGHAESTFIRNLGELRRASPEAFLKGVDAASAHAKAAVILHTAMPLIEKALAKSMPLEQFLRAGTESRLLGRKEFYNDMADQAGRASDRQLAASVDDILPVFQKIQDRRGLGRNLAQTLASLAEKKDFPMLRAFVQDTFHQAAGAVASVMTPEEFKDTRYNPNFQDALKVYQQHIEEPLRKVHEEHEGILTTHPGPLKTYFPLTPLVPEKVGVRASRQAYARPSNRNNNFATGLADAYDSSMEALANRPTAAVRAGGRAAFHDALKEVGLMQPVENALGPNGDLIAWNGVPYYAVKRTIGEPRSIIQNGKVFHKPAEEVFVPRWLAGETDPILDKSFDRQLPAPKLKEIFSNLKERRRIGLEDVGSILDAANTAAVSGAAQCWRNCPGPQLGRRH